MKNFLSEHIKSNKNRYFLLIIFVVIGIALGITAAYMTSREQSQNLTTYIENFFQNHNVKTLSPYRKDAIRQSVLFDGTFFLLLYALTFTKLHASAICFIIMIRSFISGFAIGFFIKGYGFDGFLFSLFTLCPQNFLKILLLVFFGVLALRIALMQKTNRKQNASTFFFVMVLVFLFNGILILLENILMPSLMFVFAKELM